MAFCKNCGKELKKGEKCNCTSEKTTKKTTAKKAEGFDFAKTMTAIKDDLLAYVKNPFDVVKENVDENDMPKTYVMAGLFVVSFVLFFCGIFKAIFFASSGVTGKTLKKLMENIELPYFKIGLYGLLIGAVMLVGYAVATLIVPSVFKNKKIDFKKSLTLVSSAMLPMVAVNIVCALLGFINIDYRFIIIVYILANLVATYNYVYVYAKITDIEDNKFGFAIALLIAIALGATYLTTYLTEEKFEKSVQESIKDSMMDSIDDLDL